jgi:hypothetical protein
VNLVVSSGPPQVAAAERRRLDAAWQHQPITGANLTLGTVTTAQHDVPA